MNYPLFDPTKKNICIREVSPSGFIVTNTTSATTSNTQFATTKEQAIAFVTTLINA